MAIQTLLSRYPELADDSNERLIADVHKHWFGRVMVWLTALIILVVVIAVAFSLPFLLRSAQVAIEPQVAGFMVLILLVIAALVLVGAFIADWVYTQNRMLITNENIIQVQQLSLFSRKVSHLNMINVEDVTVHKDGILPTVLNYGNIVVETAGEQENFSFSMMPDPDTYRRFIIQAHEAAIANAGRLGPSQRVEISQNNL